MKVSFSVRNLLAALFLVCQPVSGGVMSDCFNVQIYRDFAENKGIFSIDARDIAIYDKDGNSVGFLSRMMNFDSVPDTHAGEGALVGGPGFFTTVAHEYYNTTVTFTQRFGALPNTPFYDSYNSVLAKNAWDAENNFNYDFRVQRLSKIVTEAESTPYLTDPEYLDNMVGKQVFQCGVGLQSMATGIQKQISVGGAYSFMTGGTAVIGGQGMAPGNGEPLDVQKANTYPFYRFSYTLSRPTEDNPLPRGIDGGDSGSPFYVFNEKTDRWEYLAAGQSGGSSGYGLFSQTRSGNQWASDYIDSFNRTVNVSEDGGEVKWGVTDATGTGAIVQGENSTAYTGLASGLRGDTSTQGTRATNNQLAACSNLIFDGSGGTIVLQGSVDTGAGSVTFNRDYVLSNGGNASYRLNTAGFVVSEGVTVTTQLTGMTGDEWRKIGEGVLIISGRGDNAADINVGGSGLLVLDREEGVAAHNVKLNGGGAVVRLQGEDQLSGNFIFGHRGGVVDLYGHSMEVAEVTHLDEGAVFANFKEGSESQLVYKGTGRQTYLGGFADSGTGKLKVIYKGGTDAALTLHGTETNLRNGGFTVRSGEVAMEGTRTVHAGNYVHDHFKWFFTEDSFNDDDWHYARAAMNVTVESGGQFTLKHHALLEGDVRVENGGVFRMEPGVLKKQEYVEGLLAFSVDMENSRDLYGLKGNVYLENGGCLEAAMGNEEGIGQSYSGRIEGTGDFVKTGTGVILTLSGENTFSGSKEVREGTLYATGVHALGDCSSNKWKIDTEAILGIENVTDSGVLSYVDGGSSGVFALNGNNNTLERQLDFSGHQNLTLGAKKGTVLDYGTAGTTEVLQAVGGAWRIGGGGGTVNVHFLLEGEHTLYVGGGGSGRSGIVVLTNTNNGFTGNILVDKGMELGYTEIGALGEAKITLNYGSGLVFHSFHDLNSVVKDRVEAGTRGILEFQGRAEGDLDMSGYAYAFLGAAQEGTITGKLKMGNEYRLGGMGNLTVESLLDGACNLIVDGQGNSGGVISLAQANTFKGNVVVRGNLNTGEGGSITLRAGADNIISRAAQVTLEAGGRLDAAGHRVELNNLFTEEGSMLVNTGEQEGLFMINNSSDSVFRATQEGRLKLVKEDASNLSLATSLGRGTTLVVTDGQLNVVAEHQFNAGTVEVSGPGVVTANSKALGRGGCLVLKDGGSLILQSGIGPATQASDIRVEGEGNIRMGSLTYSLTGFLTVNGTLHKTGAMAVLVDLGRIRGNGTIDVQQGAFGVTSSAGTSEASFHVGSSGILRIAGTTDLSDAETFGSLSLEDKAEVRVDHANYISHGSVELKAGEIKMALIDEAQVSLQGGISGEGKLVVDGNGSTRMEIVGSNSWTGGTEIRSGASLYVGSAGALGSGSVTIDSSCLGWLGSESSMSDDATLILKGAVTLDTGSNHVVLGSQMEGTAESSFSKKGLGTLELTRDAAEYNGMATVAEGTLKTACETALGNGSLTVKNGAVLELDRTLTLTGRTEFQNGAILKMCAGSQLTLQGEASIGDVMVDFDVIRYEGGTSTLHLVQSDQGGLTGAFALAGVQDLGGSRISAILRVENDHKDLYLDVIGSRTTVTWKGSTEEGSFFSMHAADANHISTALDQDDHMMYAQDELVFAQVSAQGGEAHTVRLGADGLLSSGISVQGDDSYTLSGGVLDGDGGLTKTGRGMLTLASVNTYRGGTSLEGGTTVASGQGVFGSGAVRVLEGAVLELGQGALGEAELHLCGGRLKAETPVLSGSSVIRVGGASTVELTTEGTVAQKMEITSGSTMTVESGSNNVVWNGAISGNGTLVKTGTGIMQLGSSYQSDEANLRVEQGTLMLGTGKSSAPVTGSGSIRVESGASLRLMSNKVVYANELEFADGAFFKALDGGSGGTPDSPTYQLTGNGRLEGTLYIKLNWDKVTSFSGVLSDGEMSPGCLHIEREGKNNTSQIVLSGQNTFSGGVTMAAAAARLLITNRSALGKGTLHLNAGELAWVNYRGGFEADVELGGGSLCVDGSASGAVTMDSRISGGNLSKTGNGTLNITGELSHTGMTMVNGGNLAIERKADTWLQGDVSTGTSDSSKGTLSFRSNATISGGMGGYGTVDIAHGVHVTLNSATTSLAPREEGRKYYGSRVTGDGTLELTQNVLAFYAEATQIDPELHLSGGTVSLQGTAALTRGMTVTADAGIHFLSAAGSLESSINVLHGASLAVAGDAGVNGTATFTGGLLGYSSRTETKFTVFNGTVLSLAGNFQLDLGSMQFDEGMLAGMDHPSRTVSGVALLAGEKAVYSLEDYYGRQVSFDLSLAQGVTEQWNNASFTLDGAAPGWLGGANLSDVQYQDGMAFLTVTGFVIPEPGSAVLMLGGAAGCLVRRKRRRD